VKIFKNIILAKVFAKILSEFLRKLKTKVMAINTQKIIFLTYSQKFLCLKIPQSHKYSNKNFNRYNQRGYMSNLPDFLCLKIPQSHKYSNKNFNRYNLRGYMSNLPDFPRRPFLYAHLCVYSKSMGIILKC